jgi:hypothetical protein
MPVASWWNAFYSDISPSQINFLLFCSVWTCALAVPYLALSPRFFPAAAHKYAILAAEAATMIFWFAGFLAAAVLLSGFDFCNGTVCGAARGAIVFGAFEWYGSPPSESAGTAHDIHSVDTDWIKLHRVLFTATTIMAIIHVLRTRNDHYGKRTGVQYMERI